MYLLRIDDVGRLCGDSPEHGSDSDLLYFTEWRRQCGLEDVPACYGAIPQWLSGKGIETARSLPGITIHGWDHHRGAVLTLEQCKTSIELLGSRVYIPPFNDYTETTLQVCAQAGIRYFLGGYLWPQDSPEWVNGLLHIPAYQRYYGRASEILGSIASEKALRVITLHVPWETDPLPVRKLIDAVKQEFVPIEAVEEVASWQ